MMIDVTLLSYINRICFYHIAICYQNIPLVCLAIYTVTMYNLIIVILYNNTAILGGGRGGCTMQKILCKFQIF